MVVWPTKWVVGRERDSGRTSGVEMSHFVSPSPLFSPSPCLRMFGFRSFGTPLEMGMAGLLSLQGCLMIGRLISGAVVAEDPSFQGSKGGGR